MRGLVKHEKRNMLIITLVFTIVVWFVLQGVIANDIAGNGNQINNFDGYIYNNYGNLFLGTLNQYYELFIMILMIPISFVAVMQYRESSISKCGEFLMQLPVKRGQIFLVRTIIGMMIYTIPWLFFSFGMVMMRIQAESWYEMKLSSCTNGELLLGNDNVFHLCVYLLFMWISLTLIYAVAVFFQNICKRPWIAGAIGIGAMLFPNFMDYMMPKVLSFPDTIYHGWWMAAIFENGPITKQFIWDKGVNQLVTMASFDHFAQILLIQIVLIAVFFGVAFYVFQKSDMAKRNNFMYFPWMEHLFVWIFPFCVSLFIVVTGFKIQSYTGGILAAVIATIIYYIVEKRKKRRAV